ncbi:aldehyde dehydrogenase family protein [Nonomuraea roseoviolacea]|uniref:Acyl-CoA reductase-like NAD-dependent aldehyde dehydrogenase n=1 Tax=Nonomuraea roseoviolacea subsp. carminata TaxID=160689 RepID=A0ABT1KGI9_9ACTN|nr:aldehyde dehydrogenase family protein [Nonomuraea roseoviolacea]MCP2352506.1 acyl-CoA reductase-like NAD-dependent aldehyde dehydrogenase [Nonomuraea roseoviolacea subsp. carminata]
MTVDDLKGAWPSGLPVGDGWAETGQEREVVFPYDGSVVASSPVGTPDLARRAVEEALAVAPAMAALPSHARRAALMGAHDALAARREDVERLLVLETGKPLVDCRVEVARTLVTLATAAEEVARLHGETVPLDLLPSGEGLVGFWTRRPIGVVVGITGFNYPLLLAAHKIAPAVAAGCPVIVKPAPATPLATLWLVHLLRSAAGLPPAGVQLVTGDVEVGRTLVEDRRIGAVSFTGSAAAGHAIARAAAPTKVLLELGSNAALVVAADADLEAAADAVVRGGYYASGQACISVQRVLVEEPAREAFVALLAERVKDVVAGDPRSPQTRVAPLIDPAATERVLGWVRESGGTLVTGGVRDGRAIAPTVLADVPDGAAAWDEEIFGPVVCVRSVPDLDAAFAAVNASRYGLHAAVFTRSLATAFAAIERIEAGGVVVNDVPGFRADNMPYGGVKDSGAGREGPRFAIEELTVTRMAIIRP